MKKIKVLIVTIILLSAGGLFQLAVAQEKSKAELEKEAQVQQSILEQKKAMADQKNAQTEQDVQKKEQEKAMKDMMDVREQEIGREGEIVKAYSQQRGRSSGARAFSGVEPFMFNYQVGDAYFGHAFGGDEERTTWDFSKSIKENTFNREYTFDVEKTVKSVVMSVMGDCKTGDIRIKILMPSGKSYSDIVIDESGNLNWRKSFNISDTENLDKAGAWKFQIASNKATGFFKISLQTY